ncbi:MAG: YebC/PmpR family DNA-binding transcriptional regulator [Simkania negevensis]|nr:YebC/PmpR family DNA-binding transcriptional regulator [Simkania negevensis]
MAGHSKWANIKHKKERADAKKGKIFSRIVKEIMSAVKQGGSDPKSNPKLRLALQKARVANLPSENIERNIKKASSSDQTDFSEMTYELYGHGGVGIVVEVMTDNRNRISSDMRIATNKKGGTIASPGSVVFNFDRKGVIQVSPEGKKEEELFIAAIDAGAEDFDLAEGVYMVITPPEKLYEVKERLDQQGIISLETSLEMLPKHSVECDEETRAANQALIDYLENLDDVDAVFHNMAE